MKIEVKNLTHTYMIGSHFEKTAVGGVSFAINRGEFVGIIGHSGSGKSTLIQHLNGLLKPTSGSVFADGEDISQKGYDLKSLRFKVGLVFQYPEQQLFEETVYADIGFGPKNMGLSEEEIDKRIKSAAEAVGIKDELLLKSPFELSGGQKRRVAIAGVLAMQPKVLILDEPTAGLDPKGKEAILSRIQLLHKITGMTVILVSHSMEDIAQYAQRIIVINKSKIAMDGTPHEVFSKSGELEKIGLSVPQITRAFDILKSKGIMLDEAYNVNDAVRAVVKALTQKGGGIND